MNQVVQEDVPAIIDKIIVAVVCSSIGTLDNVQKAIVLLCYIIGMVHCTVYFCQTECS